MSSDQPLAPGQLDSEATFNLHGCRITRGALDRVWNLAKEGFTDDIYVMVSTKRRTSGITSEIKGSSIDDVLMGIKRATVAGDPDHLDNLRIYISTLGSPDRSIWINIDSKAGATHTPGVTVTVKGEDPGWVRGRAGGLKDLLEETRRHRISGGGRVRALSLFMAMLIASGLSVLATFNLPHDTSVSLVIILLVAIYVLLGVGAWYLGALIDRRTGTQLLLLPPEVQARKIDWVNVSLLIVTILGVIVGIIAILVAHADATRSNTGHISGRRFGGEVNPSTSFVMPVSPTPLASPPPIP